MTDDEFKEEMSQLFADFMVGLKNMGRNVIQNEVLVDDTQLKNQWRYIAVRFINLIND